MSLYDRLDGWIARLCTTVAVLGGLGLIFAIVVTCVSIILKMTRRTLDATVGQIMSSDAWGSIRPILGEEELVSYGVGLALFAALPWAIYTRAHVKIDLFESRFGVRLNKLLDLIGDLLFAAIAYLILTRQWYKIFKKPRRNNESELDLLFQGDVAGFLSRIRSADETQILGLKLWPLYSLAELFVLIFLIVAVFCVYRSARAFLGRDAA
ncbi:MAG: TRAP transporter small permease subunit [Pseudomonadota bacterium]